MLQYRKWMAALLVAILALSGMATALAETPSDYNKNLPQVLREGHLYSDAAVMIDALNGDVLFSKNARVRMYPASTTKIMTLMLALESGIAMDTLIVVPQAAAKIPVDSSLVPVFPGDQMTFRDLLYGFMLRSGNDGANAIAVLVSGSTEAFVERMNARAQELGCTGTHFMNAHGYHNEQHYSTAFDIALITREAMKLPSFRDIVSTQNYTMSITRGGDTIKNRVVSTNSLLNKESSYYYADCIGVKTGYHTSAGQCFVGAAERDGISLITVALHSVGSGEKWLDTIHMFNYGYTRYQAYTLEQMFSYASPRIATLKVSNAIEGDPGDGMLSMKIAQISDPEYTRMVEIDNEAALEEAINDFVSRCEMTVTGDMVAPVSEGEIMGRIRYLDQSGKEITGLLIADRTIEAQPPKTEISDVIPALKAFENPLVVMLTVVIALLILTLIIAASVRRARADRRRRQIYEARRREYMRQRAAARRTTPRTKIRRHVEDDNDDWFKR